MSETANSVNRPTNTRLLLPLTDRDITFLRESIDTQLDYPRISRGRVKKALLSRTLELNAILGTRNSNLGNQNRESNFHHFADGYYVFFAVLLCVPVSN